MIWSMPAIMLTASGIWSFRLFPASSAAGALLAVSAVASFCALIAISATSATKAATAAGDIARSAGRLPMRTLVLPSPGTKGVPWIVMSENRAAAGMGQLGGRELFIGT